MTRIKPRGRYLAISVPIALHKEISDYVKKSSYNSIAEFVKTAVREKMDKK
jgi:Arc/MetJ-type ribon-helix-helix transcriptional regulator